MTANSLFEKEISTRMLNFYYAVATFMQIVSVVGMRDRGKYDFFRAEESDFDLWTDEWWIKCFKTTLKWWRVKVIVLKGDAQLGKHKETVWQPSCVTCRLLQFIFGYRRATQRRLNNACWYQRYPKLRNNRVK